MNPRSSWSDELNVYHRKRTERFMMMTWHRYPQQFLLKKSFDTKDIGNESTGSLVCFNERRWVQADDALSLLHVAELGKKKTKSNFQQRN